MADATTTRSARAEETKRERRRKPGSTTHPGIKLAVDEGKLDRATYQYRFVKDEGTRLQQLHAQDWDPVTEKVKDDSNGLGTVNSTHGGSDEAGKPYNMILVRKPKDWFEDDQTEKQRPLDEMDKAIMQGVDHQKNASLSLRGEGVYTPGTNTIERAR